MAYTSPNKASKKEKTFPFLNEKLLAIHDERLFNDDNVSVGTGTLELEYPLRDKSTGVEDFRDWSAFRNTSYVYRRNRPDWIDPKLLLDKKKRSQSSSPLRQGTKVLSSASATSTVAVAADNTNTNTNTIDVSPLKDVQQSPDAKEYERRSASTGRIPIKGGYFYDKDGVDHPVRKIINMHGTPIWHRQFVDRINAHMHYHQLPIKNEPVNKLRESRAATMRAKMAKAKLARWRLSGSVQNYNSLSHKEKSELNDKLKTGGRVKKDDTSTIRSDMSVREGSVKSDKASSKNPATTSSKTRNSSSLVGGGGSTIFTNDNSSVATGMTGSVTRGGGGGGGGSYISGAGSVSDTVATVATRRTTTTSKK